MKRGPSHKFRNAPKVHYIIRHLDMGSGTGLLAVMSAKYLQQSCQEENQGLVATENCQRHIGENAITHGFIGTANSSTEWIHI
jgi:hypothetical protein